MVFDYSAITYKYEYDPTKPDNKGKIKGFELPYKFWREKTSEFIPGMSLAIVLKTLGLDGTFGDSLAVAG